MTFSVRRSTLVLLFAVFCTGIACAQEPEPEGLQQKRNDWFFGQRAFPHTHTPSGARQRAVRHLEQMLREQATALGAQIAVPTAAQWQLIGPQPINPNNIGSGSPNASGRVTALAVDPRNANTVYLGAAEGGIWKTTNGGQSWTPLTDTQASLSTGAIALAPSNPDIIYVGTGEFNFSDSYYGAGILKSTDAGATWTQLPGPFVGPFNAADFWDSGGANIGSIAVHPTNPNLVLAAVREPTSNNGDQSGIYRSTDGGATWTRVLAGGRVFQVVFDPANPNLIYSGMGYAGTGAATPSNVGFYKSSDSGQTWNLVSAMGMTPSLIGRIALAVGPASVIYVAVANVSNGTLLGVRKSVDQGATFTSLSIGDFCRPQCDYDLVVAVSPVNGPLGNIVNFGGSDGRFNGVSTLLRSADGGVTANDGGGLPGAHLHSDMHAIAFSADGAKTYAGNDGGVWSSNPNSSAWSSLNATLAITQYYPGPSINPSDLNSMYGGTQDNGVLRFTGSLQWDEVAPCGDGAFTAIDPTSPTIVYATCPSGSLLYRSASSGAVGSWTPVVNGIQISTDGVNFTPPFAMDPGQASRLYYGTYRLYQSTNGAGTWTPISADVTKGMGFISTIAVSPKDPNIVAVGTTDGNVGITQNAVSNPAAGQKAFFAAQSFPRAVTAVAVSPRNGTVYATLSGFSGFGDTMGHVFAITVGNGSLDSMDISHNLPNIPVNDIAVDPDADNTLYIATDIGVFYSADGGGNWAPLVNGLPRVAVLGLAFHRATRTLLAATHGRSAWYIVSPVSAAPKPAPTLTSLSPSSVIAGGAAFTLTVSGFNFVSGATVLWNGSARTTTFVNSGQLTAAITAADIAIAASISVTATNPESAASNALTFTVSSSAGTNPIPLLNSISPGATAAGGAAFTLVVTGSGFVPASVVRWNGLSRTTAFVSSTQLTAAIPAGDLAVASAAVVTVFSPTPGGGTSSGVSFFVTAGSSFPLPQFHYWPHIVTGFGYVTKMTIANLTSSQNNVVVYFLNQNGTTAQTISYSLPPAAALRTQTLESDRFGTGATKWAIVNSQGLVGINLFFEVENSGSPAVVNTLGFNDAPPLTDFTIPVEFEPAPAGFSVGRTIGIALANSSGTSATITMKLIDTNGNVLAQKVITLGPFSQTALDLQQSVPEFAAVLPASNFIGTLAVSSTQPISAVGLEDDLGPFSAIPAIAGRAK